MFDSILAFIERHQSFLLTTHDSPDADGLGAELVLASILRRKGKDVRIINSSPVPASFQFLINENDMVEMWDPYEHISFAQHSAMLVMDTSEEFHLGSIRLALKKVREVFIIDHHDLKKTSKLTGFVDPTASSTAELAVEFAIFSGIDLEPHTASAAYTGIVHDTGFFAYPKTSARTFYAAIKTLEWGANPNIIYRQLMESSSREAILLQRQALSNLAFHTDKKIALMFLRIEDFEIAGAEFEDVESIVNIPLKAKEVEVSILVRQKSTGEIFCSLRSKGEVNVSRVAQKFGGGGHVTAAGFRCFDDMDKVINKLLKYVESKLKI
ncbi:MAG: bifunctional oligoribonuclease/PAP phosphatase NrnA [Treponema sp.]|nr:bifunctional oligoribonuclease/PAP phosphatase NrnA [Treponema sp.]